MCAEFISLLDGCLTQRGLRGALGFQQSGVRLLQHRAQLESLTSFRAGHAEIGEQGKGDIVEGKIIVGDFVAQTVKSPDSCSPC